MLKDSMKGATFWEYASSRKSIILSFAKVQSCNDLAAITLPPLQSPTPPLLYACSSGYLLCFIAIRQSSL